MALVINDRVKTTSTATGNSQTTFAISATAATGFDTFAAGIGTSNTTYYCIFNQGTTEWEVGLGTLSTTTNLQRTTIITSSNSDNVVDFSAGTKDVFCTMPASKSVYLDGSGNTVNAAGQGFAIAMAVALQEKIMAQDFRNTINRVKGNSPFTILTAGNYDAVIGIRCCNVLTTSITIDVYIINSAANYYLAKDASIPPGGSIELIQGGAKVVLQSGDVLTGISSDASSLDVVCSYIDTISS